MKKIVIFGATGNIGAYLTDYCIKNLDAKKFEVVAVGRKNTDFYKKYDVQYINVDVRNKEDFNKLPTDNIYAVINTVGLLPAYLREYDPFAYVKTNIEGSLRILEYARINGADRILYTQTWADQAGYWGNAEVLSSEMPRKLLYTGDHAFYAITKSMIVDTMEYYKQEYGVKSFVFRLPNVYLYHPDKYYFVNCEKRIIAYRYMIDRASAGLPIEMWGNPEAFKDILYVKDLCQMMYKALLTDVNGGIYNAGSGIKTTLQQQIEGIVQVFSPKEKPSSIILKPEKESFTSFVMDISNAKRDLGYSPEFDYLKYLEDYREEQLMKRFDDLWRKQ